MSSSPCPNCHHSYDDWYGVCPECDSIRLRPLRPARFDDHSRPTPLLESRVRENLYLKYEGVNVTGTFKDRVMDVLVTEAADRGSKALVVASSGNAAIAASHACVRSGVPLLAVIPASAPDDRRRTLSAFGTSVVLYGEDPSDSYALARAISQEFGLLELASTFHASGTEYACRDIGHEIFAQLGEAPAAISSAISVGPVLIGAGNGVLERSGLLPALLGAQAEACSPIARAFDAGSDTVEPWEGPVDTLATSIADRLTTYPREGTYCLGRIRDSGGLVGAWDDRALAEARSRLNRTEGIDVELSSAAALLAAEAWEGAGPLVVILTGRGRETPLAEAPESFETLADRAEMAGLKEMLREWDAQLLS